MKLNISAFAPQSTLMSLIWPRSALPLVPNSALLACPPPTRIHVQAATFMMDHSRAYSIAYWTKNICRFTPCRWLVRMRLFPSPYSVFLDVFQRFFRNTSSVLPYPQEPGFPPLTLLAALRKVCNRAAIFPPVLLRGKGCRRLF